MTLVVVAMRKCAAIKKWMALCSHYNLKAKDKIVYV